MSDNLPSTSEDKRFESMDNDCTNNNDKYKEYMLRLEEAIRKCKVKSNTSKAIANIKKEINDFKAKFSAIIDKFLELNINDEKKDKFYEFYAKFIDFEKQDDYKQMEPTHKLSMLKQLANEQYYDFFTDPHHIILKDYIKKYLRQLNLEARILSLLESCKKHSYPYAHELFHTYKIIIKIIEDIIICDRLSEDKKNLFIHMYNIYYEITDYELKITRSGGKKKTRRKPRKLNKKKSRRKKSHKRKRRTRKY